MNKRIKIFGIITILAWSTYIYDLQYHPFVNLPSEWIESEEAIRKELLWNWTITLFILGIGIYSGITIFLKKKHGRIIAIGLSLCMLALKFWSLIIKSYPDTLERIYALFAIFLKKHPFLVITYDILLPVFYMTTLVVLTRKSVKNEFET